MDSGHIRPLTSLRGIAAIYVFFHHLIGYFLKPLGDQVAGYTALIINGYLWVDFFFILSGFLLALLYGKGIKGGSLSRSEFLIRRFARIYPLHLVILVLFVLVQLALVIKGNDDVFTGPYSWWDLLRSLFLVHAIQVHPTFTPWNGPSWSISAEWCAYLLFPWLVLLIYRIRSGLWQCLFWVISFLMLALVSRATNRELDLTGYLGLARCFLEFSMGIMLYLSAYQSQWSRRWLTTSASQVLLLAGILFSLHFETADLVTVVMMVLLIASMGEGETAVTKVLSQRWLVFLGTISYSIYMVHWLVFSVVDKAGSLLAGIEVREVEGVADISLVIGLCTGLVLVVSVLCFRMIEEPLRKWLPKVLTVPVK